MTFDDAVIKKAKLPSVISYQGKKMKIYVVPQLTADLEKYVAYFEGHRITNKTALAFSTDNQFTVKGISVSNDAISILSYNDLMKEVK